MNFNELERKTCPSCGEQNCNYDCDGSQFDDYNDNVVERIQYNTICAIVESFVLTLSPKLRVSDIQGILDIVESFVLALSPKLSVSDIQEVLDTVADAIDNNLG